MTGEDSMDKQVMRSQFEAKFPVPAGAAWKESIGKYEVVDAWALGLPITIGKYNWRWEGWQASREAVEVELPNAFSESRFCEWVINHAEAVRAIEAHGLKVKK